MIEIKDLLGKFSHLLASSEFAKESVRDIISKTINVEINSQDIEIKNGTIYLNIKPIYKNEILLKKERIHALLGEVLGKGAPRDLR